MSFSTVKAAPALPAPPVRPALPRWAAWLLLLPVFGTMIFSYGWPTVQLVIAGLTADHGTTGWSSVVSTPILDQFGNALSYGLLPVVLLVTVAPAFAWAASRAGLPNRWLARAAIALPLAAYAPTGLTLVWLSERGPETLTFTRWDGRLVMVATLGAFVVGVGTVCYLAALRRRTRDDTTIPAVLIVGSLLVLAAVAYALQQYTYVRLVEQAHSETSAFGGSPMAVLAVNGGDPARSPLAVSLLLVLAILGAVATVIVLRSRLVLEYDPTRRSADDEGRSRMAVVGTAVGVLALALFSITQLGPWLVGLAAGVSDVGDGVAAQPYGGQRAIFDTTWGIPLGTALVQVTAAVLGGYAIAVGRPLGRHSEWLLLAFTPWLFVGDGLMQLPRLDADAAGLQLLLAYGPISWLSVPALLLFTMFFRGQYPRLVDARSASEPGSLGRTMWPILPLAAFTVGVLWLVQAQDLIVATLADAGDGVVANAQLILAQLGLPEAQPALGYPILLLLLFTVGGLILQWTFLDRVAVRVSPPPAEDSVSGGRRR